MARFVRPMRGVAVALAVVGCVFSIGVSTASAASSSLTVSIQPKPLTAGGQGVVQATFHNGSAKLAGVALFLTFGSPVAFTPGTGCNSLAPLFPKTAVCFLGGVAANSSVTKNLEFTVPSTGPVTVKGAAGYLSFGPLAAGIAKGSDSADVVQPGAITAVDGVPVQTGTSGCLGQGGSVSTSFTSDQYENGTAGTDVTATGVNGLPCAPVVTGVATDNSGKPTLLVDGTGQFQNGLTFPDEFMPWPDNENGTPPPEGFDNRAGYILYEDYPGTSNPEVHVPPCNEDGSVPTNYGAEHPTDDEEGYSTDSCVVSVVANDPDEDSDAGTITVNYNGTGGDPGYHG